MINISLTEINIDKFNGNVYDYSLWEEWSYTYDHTTGMFYYTFEDTQMVWCLTPTDSKRFLAGNVPPTVPALEQIGDLTVDTRPLGITESTLLKSLAVVLQPELAFKENQ